MTEDDFMFEDEQPDNALNDLFKDWTGDSIPVDGEEQEVTVVGVFEHRILEEDHQSESVVVVRDDNERTVLIVIGRFEAAAISVALEGRATDRPLPHDLLNNIITKLGGTVTRVLIDDLCNGTFYAKVSIQANKSEIVVDSRPSDAIALALRTKSPVFMAEHILRSVGFKVQ